MTQQEKNNLTVKMGLGFLASTVVTVASVVWTGATLYYKNEAAIQEVKNQNTMQDYRIQANTNALEKCCPPNFLHFRQ